MHPEHTGRGEDAAGQYEPKPRRFDTGETFAACALLTGVVLKMCPRKKSEKRREERQHDGEESSHPEMLSVRGAGRQKLVE